MQFYTAESCHYLVTVVATFIRIRQLLDLPICPHDYVPGAHAIPFDKSTKSMFPSLENTAGSRCGVCHSCPISLVLFPYQLPLSGCRRFLRPSGCLRGSGWYRPLRDLSHNVINSLHPSSSSRLSTYAAVSKLAFVVPGTTLIVWG